MAIALAEAGARVVVASPEVDELHAVAKEIESQSGKGRALAVPTDITKRNDCENLLSECRRVFGGAHVLVNNAKRLSRGPGLPATGNSLPFWESDPDIWRQTVDVNVSGTFLISRTFPGNPTVIVQNMPGAGSMTAANWLYNVGPKDGTALGIFAINVTIDALFGNSAANYDPLKFEWIGNMAQNVGICGVWHTAGIRTFQELKQKEALFGATGPAGATYQSAVALRNLSAHDPSVGPRRGGVVNVKQLRYFLGVVEAGSLSKAADPLHVAQPALGIQIRNLEQELGVELLQRHARGVVPTRAGEVLARRAESLLREFDRIRQEMMDFGVTPSGRVTIGVTSTVGQRVVARFVEKCRKKYPEVRLVIMTVRGTGLIDKLMRAEIDMGLAFRPQDNDEVVSEALINDELVFVHSKNLPPEVDFRSIAANELILTSESHLLGRMVKRAAAAIGQELQVIFDADSVTIIKELVKSGLGPTILPLTAVQEEVQEGKLFTATITNADFVRTLFLLQSTRRVPSRPVELVRDELRSLVGEIADSGLVGWTRIKDHGKTPNLPDEVRIAPLAD